MKTTFSKTELQDFAKFCAALKIRPEDILEATVEIWAQNIKDKGREPIEKEENYFGVEEDFDDRGLDEFIDDDEEAKN